MKKLPIGIQTFSKLIKENCVYVDKTRHIKALIDTGEYFFLSRPRRFGKSLLISTLSEIFSGHQALFQGLYIHDQIQWESYPVIHIDFSAIDFSTDIMLRESLYDFLDGINADYQLDIEKRGFKIYFRKIIQALSEKKGKVVVLIDEYDKPIVEHINNIEMATKNREILREFFGVLKPCDAFLRFVFLTGVSKFSRVSIFSDLNHIRDITFSKQFATLLGYTQNELENDFEPYIESLGLELEIKKIELLAKIKHWYNGYSWNGKDRVYNPFSILNLFAEQQFDNYWFASGTPTFLIKLIKNKPLDVTQIENQTISKILFDSFNIETLNLFALLFQTGYLTINEIVRNARTLQYVLNYPNFEVKEAFLTYLFASFTDNELGQIQPASENLRAYLEMENIEGFMEIIRVLFAKIPYSLHIEQEAYYHSLFYMILALMGVEIDLEVLTDKGRIDGILPFDKKIYLIEFKYAAKGTSMSRLTNQAIKQIKNKNYGERFLTDARPLIYLGVGFLGKKIGYKKVAIDVAEK
jgi:hypothetical protein